MEQLWAIFSTLWKNLRQKFHTVEKSFPHRGKLSSPSRQDRQEKEIQRKRRNRR
jgi:hypothetical protein